MRDGVDGAAVCQHHVRSAKRNQAIRRAAQNDEIVARSAGHNVSTIQRIRPGHEDQRRRTAYNMRNRTHIAEDQVRALIRGDSVGTRACNHDIRACGKRDQIITSQVITAAAHASCNGVNRTTIAENLTITRGSAAIQRVRATAKHDGRIACANRHQIIAIKRIRSRLKREQHHRRIVGQMALIGHNDIIARTCVNSIGTRSRNDDVDAIASRDQVSPVKDAGHSRCNLHPSNVDRSAIAEDAVHAIARVNLIRAAAQNGDVITTQRSNRIVAITEVCGCRRGQNLTCCNGVGDPARIAQNRIVTGANAHKVCTTTTDYNIVAGRCATAKCDDQRVARRLIIRDGFDDTVHIIDGAAVAQYGVVAITEGNAVALTTRDDPVVSTQNCDDVRAVAGINRTDHAQHRGRSNRVKDGAGIRDNQVVASATGYGVCTAARDDKISAAACGDLISASLNVRSRGHFASQRIDAAAVAQHLIVTITRIQNVASTAKDNRIRART